MISLSNTDTRQWILNKAMSNENIADAAPSAMASRPHARMSDRYRQVSTISVIDTLRKDGWVPVRATQSRCNLETKEGFQKHMICFGNPDLVIRDSSEFLQMILTNSHNGSSCYELMAGVYRLVCSNGLVVGSSFESIHIKHVGFEISQILNASSRISSYATRLGKNISGMKSVTLSSQEQGVFAKSAQTLLYDKDEVPPFDYNMLLTPKRREDNDNSLWTTFNRVQENITKGGIRYINERGNRIKTRPIKSINRDIDLNRSLWTLAEEMKKLKQTA